MSANATPTFGVFVAGTGVSFPFDPAHSRIFLLLQDQAGQTLGSTSVAAKILP